MQKMTREEAERVATAICDDVERTAVCGNWRAGLYVRIRDRLCPPPKLEWEFVWVHYSTFCEGSWVAGDWRIRITPEGEFYIKTMCGAQLEELLRRRFPTLAEAKAAAQQHAESQHA